MLYLCTQEIPNQIDPLWDGKHEAHQKQWGSNWRPRIDEVLELYSAGLGRQVICNPNGETTYVVVFEDHEETEMLLMKLRG